ncbi:MAG: hypothetical protein NVSMB9_33800 [Isosphaeraceae bacterium]
MNLIPSASSHEPRIPVDRRQSDVPLWNLRRLRGRRRRNRRADEHHQLYLVDRVSNARFAAAVLLLVLTLVDGWLTLLLLDHGFEEVNPVMRCLLDRGPLMFFAGKYLLTALFLPAALVLNQYRLFGTALRVGHLVLVASVLYLPLIAYQVVLWLGS